MNIKFEDLKEKIIKAIERNLNNKSNIDGLNLTLNDVNLFLIEGFFEPISKMIIDGKIRYIDGEILNVSPSVCTCHKITGEMKFYSLLKLLPDINFKN